MKTLSAVLIGCGGVGRKRARWINEDGRTRLVAVVDSNLSAAEQTAREFNAKPETDWKKAVRDAGVDIAVVSTPNHLLFPIASLALRSGKHVLVEKPMARNLKEARELKRAAEASGRSLKVGFNHRYHPALREAREAVSQGTIGRILNLRAVYGHGGRQGYEKEWRGNYKLCGGGEMTDQGVHLIDLMEWFCGEPTEAACFLQTAFWKIKPSEDNGFALLKFKGGVLGSFHSSWTQWKNKFLFEVHGEKGFVSVQGLGGSYGPETLTVGTREKPGEVPQVSEKTFDGEDKSWKEEWDDFVCSLLDPRRKMMGDARQGLSVVKVLDALYRSNKSGKAIHL